MTQSPKLDPAPVRTGPAPFIVVVWGDSIAASGWPDRSEFMHNVIQNAGRSVKIINMGVGGMPACTAKTQFAERVARHEPDLVIIQFGFNDLRSDGSRPNGLPLSTPEEFSAHLQEMIHRCKTELHARVVVLGNHRPRAVLRLLSGKTYVETTAIYREESRKAALAQNVPYIDMSVETTAGGLAWTDVVNEDGVHLSPAGLNTYAAIASNIYMDQIRAAAQ
jgi:lysophospholipase L1-like esterase